MNEYRFEVPRGCPGYVTVGGSDHGCTREPGHIGAHRVDGWPGCWWVGYDHFDMDAWLREQRVPPFFRRKVGS